MFCLNNLSLIFTGEFQPDVSTVKNDVRHYDNSSFEKRFQLPKARLHHTFNGHPEYIENTFGLMNDLKLIGQKLCSTPFPGSTDQENMRLSFEYVELPLMG